ncbi:MAG: hypothetical protein HC875_03240 [Anaerolineales bacterium]|nr:hypothetical protein [Anaerolineales bacterium]
MWNKIKGWLAPPVFEDEDKTRVAYLLNIILLGLVPATAALGIATLWVLPEGDFRIKMVFILTLVFIGLYSLTKFRFIKLPSILLVLALWSAFTLVMFRLGGCAPLYMASILSLLFSQGC